MDVTDVIGGFGAWQRKIFYVLLYQSIPAAFVIFNLPFFAPDADFCCVKWSVNITVEKGSTFCYDSNRCEKWADKEYFGEGKTGEYVKCASWEFKPSEYGTSIKQEWNLVCHRAWLLVLSYLLLILGSIISYIPAGHLCDKYGRRRLCLIGMMALVVVSLAGIFSPNLEYFLVVRLITGISYGILETAALCLFVESVSPEYRISMSLACMGTWGLGIMILPGVAFLLKDWRMLQLVTCVLSLILPILVWKFVPESPRWLLAVGKYEEAKKIICEAAKLNGIEILDVDSVMQDLKRKFEDEEIAESASKYPTFSDLWHSKTMKRIIVILYFAFFTTIFIYYGFTSLLEERLGNTSLHLKMFELGVGEAIGSAIFILQAKFMSRKKSLFRNFFFSGFFFCIALTIEYHLSLQISVGIIAATINSLAYTFLWLFAAEIFPTHLRAAGISRGMCLGRIGSIFVSSMVKFRIMELKNLSFTFAGLAFFTSALCLLLPNIKEKPLPDTIEESKRLPETTRINRRGVDRTEPPEAIEQKEAIRTELVSFFHRVFVSRN